MTKRTRRAMLAPLIALILLASPAMPAHHEAAARTACADSISTSYGTGYLIGGYCPIQLSCCSLGAFTLNIFSCSVCECAYLISGSYFGRNVQAACWIL